MSKIFVAYFRNLLCEMREEICNIAIKRLLTYYYYEEGKKKNEKKNHIKCNDWLYYSTIIMRNWICR